MHPPYHKENKGRERGWGGDKTERNIEKREVKMPICLFFETCLQDIAEDDLEFLILLPPFPKGWNYKHVTPYLLSPLKLMKLIIS